MEQQREILDALLKDFRTASQLIDGAAYKSRQLGSGLDQVHFVRGIAEVLTKLFELESDLFDLEPTLTYDFLKPSLDAVNLTDAIARLSSQNQAVRKATIQEFKQHMLDEVAAQFETACSLGTERDFAQTWWNRQRHPFLPVVKAYKFLSHSRRFMRYYSAKALEEKFGVKIWDDASGDVSLEVADAWLSAWLVYETCRDKQ